mgnify:CR=1 FL=1
MFSDRQKPKAMNEIGGQPNRIEKNTKIKGDIISEADFRIDGKLDGNVKTSGKVVIGKDGYIHGKVEPGATFNAACTMGGKKASGNNTGFKSSNNNETAKAS